MKLLKEKLAFRVYYRLATRLHILVRFAVSGTLKARIYHRLGLRSPRRYDSLYEEVRRRL